MKTVNLFRLRHHMKKHKHNFKYQQYFSFQNMAKNITSRNTQEHKFSKKRS